MKKILFTLLCFVAISATAQNKGRFEVQNMGNFKLHIYYTNDVMGDASYIVEGRKSIVAMEYPLFKENATEFDAYIAKLDKPVEQVITDYHEGGSGKNPQVMAEGMPAFMKGDIYGGMITGFKQAFGETMVDLSTEEVVEIPFGSTQKWAGVSFEFQKGATTDFPAASILIGKKVYYTHWTPAKSHVSHLQVSSPSAIDAEIAEAEKSLHSGAVLFIGGHGGAAHSDAVEFKIAYLKKMKQSMSENKTPEAFVAAMEKAYPGLAGEAGLGVLAESLYK